MTKHGLSHAGATLVSTVAAGLLVRQLEVHLPEVSRPLEQFAHRLVVVLALPWSTEVVAQFLLASALAFVWGVAFKARECSAE